MTGYLFRDHWPARGLAPSIASLRSDALFDEYENLRDDPPRRSQPYIVDDHHGTTDHRLANKRGIQYEPRYAIALWNLGESACVWPRSDGGRQCFVDYQVPLKAVREDREIGEVDLLGITDQGRLIVVELKFPRSGRGDSPMRALIQGLRYAAVVEGRSERIAKEIEDRCGCEVDRATPPIVQLLAPCSWWRAWLDPKLKRAAGDWNRELDSLASKIEKSTGVTVECLATDTSIPEVEAGLREQRPTLDRAPNFFAVRLASSEFVPLR